MRHLFLLVLAVSLVGILASPLAFSQNFDEMIPTAYAEVVTPGMKTTSECEDEKSGTSCSVAIAGGEYYRLSFNFEKDKEINLEWSVRGGEGYPGLNIEVTNEYGDVIMSTQCKKTEETEWLSHQNPYSYDLDKTVRKLGDADCSYSFTACKTGLHDIKFENLESIFQTCV